MEVLDDLLYTKEHEWVKVDGAVAIVGITDYAQAALGDVTYIELPEMNAEVDQFEQIATLESVKAASDIFSPLSGKVLEVNTELNSTPELINKSCYEKGWIAKIEITDIGEISNLMKSDEYGKFLETQESSEDPEEK